METTVEPLEGNRVKLSVQVDEREFDDAIDAAFRKIARQVRIPGFRPGRVPRRILEARLGADVAREEALRDALPDYYARAVREHAIDVIAAPEIDITAGQEEGPVAFDAVVEIRPVVTVPGYQGLRVEIPRPTATDEELDAQIDRMRAQHAELREVDRPAIDGDVVGIDIAGSQGGEQIDGLTADDYAYEVGSGGILPEVDEQLRGAKIGDILEFDAEHPDPEQEAVHFRVLVKQVQERVLPEADDEWAQDASEFDTLEELRADLSTRLNAMKAVQAQMALREKVAAALAELVTEELPDALVQAEMQARLHDLSHRLEHQGMDLEQYLAATGTSQQDFAAELRATSESSVRVDLGLRAVAAAEGLQPDEDEVDAEIERLAGQMGERPAALRRQLERADRLPAVRSDLIRRQALEWLVEHVELVDPDGQAIDRADLQPPTGEPDPSEPTDDATQPRSESEEATGEEAEQ